ncbi:LOW QUALITY PROTEIN: hypothetical protein HID58_059830 [Brassica napus]|uniref:F-box domain-containing protein n=1 Tax=Brassica napus TaxID=3708 RepID=A0ABQ7ZU00_BRANA|nr:LOW QUALITY PROTEIN: hypothetical protein HID58_059830 [Brassica napus]
MIGERNRSQRKLKPETSSTGDNEDFISYLPDEILHHIISFNPTKLAAKTSVLSRRWRHVWCETPLSLLSWRGSKGINQTMVSYRALKLTSFRLDIAYPVSARQIKRTRDVPIPPTNPLLLGTTLRDICFDSQMHNNVLGIHKKLDTERLNLSKSLSLRRLEIKWSFKSSYPVEIVAPHIHYLKLTMYEESCTLVDVSSVTQASLEIFFNNNFFWVAEFVQIMVLKMLEKLQNIERLTLGRTLLQMLSLAELCGRPFPMLRVQTLIVETMVVRSAILGITRLLQNSPVLKKLLAQATCSGTIKDQDLDYYLSQRGLNPEQCWRSEYSELSYLRGNLSDASNLSASFMELVLRNSKTLETIVVQFRSTPLALECFAQLLQMPPTLPHNNNVSIVLNPSNYSLIASVLSLI